MSGVPGLLSPGCVVLAYGEDRLHEPLVSSLLADGIPAESMVIVHNPARPGEPRPAGIAGVAVLPMERNIGYAGGMNAGISHLVARHFDWILMLTNDVRFHPNAVDGLRQAAATAGGYGLLGPVMRASDERLYYGGRRDGAGRIRFRWDDPAGPEQSAVVETDWIQGSAMLVRREVFERIGLLEERFFMYFEESDLCLRTARAGWRIGVVRASIAEQQYGHLKRPALHSYLMARNGHEYMRRASGSRGVALWLWRSMTTSWDLLKVWKGRRSDRHQRRRARATLLAKWQGTAAFFTGRWGVPPAWLWNEVVDVQQPQAQAAQPAAFR